jgi:hypothetical protein
MVRGPAPQNTSFQGEKKMKTAETYRLEKCAGGDCHDKEACGAHHRFVGLAQIMIPDTWKRYTKCRSFELGSVEE